MSKTKRDQIKGRIKDKKRKYDLKEDKLIKKLKKKGYNFWDALCIARYKLKHPYDQMTFQENIKAFPQYSKSPSWWNKMFNNKPKKRETTNMLKKIDLNTDCDDLVFPDDNKPHKYYW